MLTRFPADFMFQLSAGEAAGFKVAICDLKERPRSEPRSSLSGRLNLRSTLAATSFAFSMNSVVAEEYC